MKTLTYVCYILIEVLYLSYLSEGANELHVSVPFKHTTRSIPRRDNVTAVSVPVIPKTTRLPALPVSHKLPVRGGSLVSDRSPTSHHLLVSHIPVSHRLTTIQKIQRTRKPFTRVKNSTIKLVTEKSSTLSPAASNLTTSRIESIDTTHIPKGFASSWALIVIIVIAVFIFLLISVLIIMCVCCKKGLFHIYREQHRAKTYNRMAEEIRDISTVHPEQSDMSYGTLPHIRAEK